MLKCEGLGKITLLAIEEWSFQIVGTVYRQWHDQVYIFKISFSIPFNTRVGAGLEMKDQPGACCHCPFKNNIGIKKKKKE